jgi:hypothetical protein
VAFFLYRHVIAGARRPSTECKSYRQFLRSPTTIKASGGRVGWKTYREVCRALLALTHRRLRWFELRDRRLLTRTEPPVGLRKRLDPPYEGDLAKFEGWARLSDRINVAEFSIWDATKKHKDVTIIPF